MKVKPRTVLVFGEDENDCIAVSEFTKALVQKNADLKVVFRRSPVVHLNLKDKPKTRLDNASRIAKQLRAENIKNNVVAVIAHQDCDRVEPAHVDAALVIERELHKSGIPNPIAAAPAWEVETWLMQFPAALKAARGCWKDVDYGNRDLGQIVNSKEQLRSDLRPDAPDDRKRCRDYSESDAPVIAAKARELGLITTKRKTKCASFDAFVEKVSLIR